MLQELAPDLYLQHHPLSMAGCQMGRVVTLIRLTTGDVVIHSTAKFTQDHIDEILTLGNPSWLVEATYFHDTCSEAGRTVFPELPYLVPPGMKGAEALNSLPLLPAPEAWGDELQVIEIGGMPKIREHAFYHRPSRTLIVADLLFNLPPESGRWTQTFLRLTGGIHTFPGMSRLFRLMIKDRSAFLRSIEEITALEIDRIIVGHGKPIVKDAKAQLLDQLAKHGLTT